MGFAAPCALGRKRDQMRRRRNRQCQRGGECIECMIARDAGEVERLQWACGRVGSAGAPEKTSTMRVAEQRKDYIAACIEIVNRDEKLAKPRLPKIVGQQFHI